MNTDTRTTLGRKRLSDEAYRVVRDVALAEAPDRWRTFTAAGWRADLELALEAQRALLRAGLAVVALIGYATVDVYGDVYPVAVAVGGPDEGHYGDEDALDAAVAAGRLTALDLVAGQEAEEPAAWAAALRPAGFEGYYLPRDGGSGSLQVRAVAPAVLELVAARVRAELEREEAGRRFRRERPEEYGPGGPLAKYAQPGDFDDVEPKQEGV
jgi:hypothetical protein